MRVDSRVRDKEQRARRQCIVIQRPVQQDQVKIIHSDRSLWSDKLTALLFMFCVDAVNVGNMWKVIMFVIDLIDVALF